MNKILTHVRKYQNSSKKQLAVLVDPDKCDASGPFEQTISIANKAKVDFFFVGGSLLTTNRFEACIQTIREHSDIPIVIFPGSPAQVSSSADGILFLSLISGRNADALIGAHVLAAPVVKASGIEVLPTGYMIVDSGRQTTASYMSNSTPIPYDKPDIAACTALAGQLLGLQLVYLDGGSGAQKPISEEMIRAVKSQVDIPVIVGGGIRDADTATAICQAGADIIVVGNAIEKDPNLIPTIAHIIHSL